MSYKYKVVYTDDSGRFVSVIAEKRSRVTYEINKYVTAPDFLKEQGYYLFVFDTLEHAKDFTDLGRRIFKCKVKGQSYTKNLPIGLDLMKLRIGLVRPIEDIYLYAYPKGTEMWEYVKLIEEVI